MRVKELVGWRVREARKERGWTQERLGKELGRYLGGEGWSKQAVSLAEKGHREFTAEELAALVLVLHRSPARFFHPSGIETVEFPGENVPPHEFGALLATSAEIQEAIEGLDKWEKKIQAVRAQIEAVNQLGKGEP